MNYNENQNNNRDISSFSKRGKTKKPYVVQRLILLSIIFVVVVICMTMAQNIDDIVRILQMKANFWLSFAGGIVTWILLYPLANFKGLKNHVADFREKWIATKQSKKTQKSAKKAQQKVEAIRAERNLTATEKESK